MKILIADIEPDFNNTLKRFFEKLGFTAYTADTKEEAIGVVEKYKPDIVSIDVREKPHYSLRLDVLKKIKEIDKNIRIIVVTTYEEEDVDVIKAIGIDGYFNKPLNLENYLALIKGGKKLMMKLLIVDDEKGITDALKEFFEHRGFAVTAVNNGEGALETLKKDKPDIVFLDIVMKGISGLEVLKHIKSIDKNIKIIMLTIHEEKDIIEKAKQLGADEYITKPFRIDYLEDVVIKKVQELLREQHG